MSTPEPVAGIGPERTAQPTTTLTRQVFVAYAYGIYDKRDYRKVFASLENSFGVKFIFADEKITNMHILAKIVSYIRASDFCLFDITGWNPNVTLELGIAMQAGNSWYICFNPKKAGADDVPSDIKGMDRIQYESFAEMEEKLGLLLAQRYPKPERRESMDDFFRNLQKQAVDFVELVGGGMSMADIAGALGVAVPVAQAIVGPLVGIKLRIEGVKRGAKYFPIGDDS